MSEAPTISDRQRQVLALIGDGLSIQEIADRMEMPFRTSKYHIDELRRKFGCANKRELVLISREYLK